MLNTEEEEIIVTEVTGLIIELGVDQDQENDYGNRSNDRFVNRQSYRRENFRHD